MLSQLKKSKLLQKSNGVFITFEGGEGAGKTTLIEGIFKELALAGYPVFKTREPGGTLLGEEIRTVLLHHKEPVAPLAELSLFLASRAQHVVEKIRPALEEGKIVLCDRFNDSTIAYQGAARGLGVDKITQFCKFICDGVHPHLTLYLDIDPKLGLMRVAEQRQQDRIEQEDLAFHETIRKAYLSIHQSDPTRFHILDASLSPRQVLEKAMNIVQPFIRLLA